MRNFVTIILYFLPGMLFSQPNAAFTVDRYNICSGTTVQFNNQSSGANAYQWIIDGVNYSNSYDTTAVLVEGCYDLIPIQLIAFDTLTNTSDTAQVVVEVFDSCFFHWTGDFIACIGDTITMAVNPEEIATEFTIDPPHILLSGCLTCPAISFILNSIGTMVDRKSFYLGGCSEITSFHYFFCNVAVTEKSEDYISVYPNPVTGTLYIDNKYDLTSEVTLINSSGHHVYFDKNINEINFNNYPQGLYLLKIETGSNMLIKKIIRE